MPEFVHLHVHSEYSLLDGLARIDDLFQRARDLKMPALALTDHGVLYGAIEFYQKAAKYGIKPIIGCEVYVARRGIDQRSPDKDSRAHHLTLLAQDEQGYRNLLQLTSRAQLEGFYYKPRVDKELLAQHATGLIALSGCNSAELPRLLKAGRLDKARQLAGWFREVFGPDNYYFELQEHDIPELTAANKELIAMSRAMGIPLVATNDVHYVAPQDAYTHEVLLCIQTNTTINNPKRMRYGPSFHMRTAQEMAHLFPDIPEALRNSLVIAERCNLNLQFDQYHLPPFDVPAGFDAHSYLRYLCEDGLRGRYDPITPELRQRLEYELQIIHEMGFDTYFLIVWDLCRYAREEGIWFNVRGSAASSIVAYALRITNLDPLEHGLIFERFLNKGRVTMPDIDLDFPDDQRDLLIQYTIKKYGHDRVAQIITFGTMGARAAVRDAGRALDYPPLDVDRVARLIPAIPGKPVSIQQALEEVSELRQLYEEKEHIRRLLDTAQGLEGVARHASTHAAGIVVADQPLVNYVPLHRPTGGSRDGAVVTQYPMESLESIGLLKLDFLGLSTLTIMRRATELIKQHHGVTLDIESIPVDDPAIYELLSSGEVTGIFQVEGAGMRRVLTQMQPKEFDHIVAAISLYRPGPMEYIPNYIRRMHGDEKIEYRHPKLKPILDETYGICVYQEQIIRMAQDLAGYDASEADLMRRAVGKKKKEELLEHRDKFVTGAVARGIPKQVANQIFDDIEFFARYGFNKCLPGDVEVIDGNTGRLVKVEDLYSGAARMEQTVVCNTGTLKMGTAKVASVRNNGVKPVFRLTTALGRQIEATGNHPFYTFDGWWWLEELQVGDLIAVPRRLSIEGNTQWPDHEVIVLGHLLAEGNLCHPHSVYFYTQDEEQLDDYIKAVEQFDNVRCSVSLHKGSYLVYAKRIQPDQEPGVVRWAKELGIWGKKANEKEIPAAAFELNSRQIALLLSRLWTGDGHLSDQGDGYICCYYATASERLARQIQHLLLRLGVVSRLRTVNFPYRDGRIGYQVFVMGGEDIKNFAATVGLHFVNQRYRHLCVVALATDYDTARGTRDVIPVQVKGIVRAASDIYWDEIVSIEYAGEKQTYDLTVPGFHNFVANDILVHNSHAADYAMLTCQTAYLKARYPVEYMAALLSVERGNSEKIASFVAECQRMGIPILPPDVNKSELDFTIERIDHRTSIAYRTASRVEAIGSGRWMISDQPSAIRFGLGAIKNVGDGPVELILKARRGRSFANLDDFCQRVDLRGVNRRALECLIKCGALDRFGSRGQLLAAIDRMMGVSQQLHQAQEVGQMSLFDMGGTVSAGPASLLHPLPPAPDVSTKEQLAWEKELLGTYLSEHPLHRVAGQLEKVITALCGKVDESLVGQKVVIGGMVTGVRTITTKKGDLMAFARLEDLDGSVEVVVFPRTYEGTRHLWVDDTLVLVTGRVEVRKGNVQVICDSAAEFMGEEAVESSSADGSVMPAKGGETQPVAQNGRPAPSFYLHITIPRSEDQDQDIRRIGEVYRLLEQFEGQDQFSLYVAKGSGMVQLDFPNASTGYCVGLERALTEMLGEGAIRVESKA